jgi:transposase
MVAGTALSNEHTIRDIATKYSVHPSQVVQWKKTLIEMINQHGFKLTGVASNKEAAQVPELMRIVGKQAVEIEFLKKKLGY